MTIDLSEERGAIGFAERILNLLNEGSYTATYKYAVLLGLIDLCMEKATAAESPPESITTRQLAEKVVELYWPHTAPYPTGRRAVVLRQNSGGQAKIVSLIRTFRESLPTDPLAPLHRARRADEARFLRLVKNVEWKLIEMPLPRLQTVGSATDRFIYEIAWSHDVSLRDVRRYQRDASSPFDNVIRLRPTVERYLVQLNGLLRPLIHRCWTGLVARFNKLEEASLERFLFGSKRADLEPVRRPLVELQLGRCFYCSKGIRRTANVDHFIPWSRYPDDGLDNLVAADQTCNGRKRDFLASIRHVERWRERITDPALAEVVTLANWYRDPGASLGVAQTVYMQVPAGTPLWDHGSDFRPADPVAVAKALTIR